MTPALHRRGWLPWIALAAALACAPAAALAQIDAACLGTWRL